MKLIFEKWKNSNRDAPANVTYRLKYWRDVTVADNGDLFLLLNLDDKMRIYRITNEGKVLKCYFGNIKDISMIDIVGDDLYAYDKQTQTFFHFELPAID